MVILFNNVFKWNLKEIKIIIQSLLLSIIDSMSSHNAQCSSGGKIKWNKNGTELWKTGTLK